MMLFGYLWTATVTLYVLLPFTYSHKALLYHHVEISSTVFCPVCFLAYALCHSRVVAQHARGFCDFFSNP